MRKGCLCTAFLLILLAPWARAGAPTPFNYPEPPREGAVDYFRIAENGKPRCVIVAPVAAGVAERAARALKAYLDLVTGASFPLIRDGSPIPPEMGAIHVGDTAIALRVELGLPEVRYGDDAYPNVNGYLVSTLDPRTLVIRGATEKATEFGVVGFLRRYVGVRQYWLGRPGGPGDVIPSRPTLAIPEVEWRDWPYVLSRWLSIHSFPHGVPVSIDFFRRNNVLPCGENYYAWLPPEKYREAHPEYFSLVRGERRAPRPGGERSGWQPCVSNPDVVRIMTDGVLGYFRENPLGLGRNFSINDGGGNCECESCRAMDAPGTDYARNIGMTDRYVKFTNAVAEAVAREHPGKLLVFLAYGGAAHPPITVRLRENVLPVLTVNNAFEAWDGWSATGPTRMGLYLHHNDNIYFILPKSDTAHTARRIRYAVDSGRMRVFYMESGTLWPTTGHLASIISDLLWDPRQDPDALMEQYCADLFGPAGEAMREFYETLEVGTMRWIEEEGVPHPAGKDIAGTRHASAPEQFRTLNPAEADRASAALAKAAATPGLDARAQRRIEIVQAAFRLQELAARRYWLGVGLTGATVRSEADARRVVEDCRRIIALTGAIKGHVDEILDKAPIAEYKLFQQLRPSENISYAILRSGETGPALAYALDSGVYAAGEGLEKSLGRKGAADWWRKTRDTEESPALKALFHAAELRASGLELKNLLQDPGFEDAGRRMKRDERELDHDVPLHPPELRQVGGIYAWFPERSPYRAALTKDNPRSGSYCLVMEHFYRAVFNMQNGVPAKPGARYRAGLWVKRNAAPGRYRVAISASTTGGGVAKPLMEVVLEEPFDQWREVVADVVAPPDVRRLSVQLFVDRQDKDARCWVDDVFIGEYPAARAGE